MAGLLRDSDIMQHFVHHPQVKLTTCGERIASCEENFYVRMIEPRLWWSSLGRTMAQRASIVNLGQGSQTRSPCGS